MVQDLVQPVAVVASNARTRRVSARSTATNATGTRPSFTASTTSAAAACASASKSSHTQRADCSAPHRPATAADGASTCQSSGGSRSSHKAGQELARATASATESTPPSRTTSQADGCIACRRSLCAAEPWQEAAAHSSARPSKRDSRAAAARPPRVCATPARACVQKASRSPGGRPAAAAIWAWAASTTKVARCAKASGSCCAMSAAERSLRNKSPAFRWSNTGSPQHLPGNGSFGSARLAPSVRVVSTRTCQRPARANAWRSGGNNAAKGSSTTASRSCKACWASHWRICCAFGPRPKSTTSSA